MLPKPGRDHFQNVFIIMRIILLTVSKGFGNIISLHLRIIKTTYSRIGTDIFFQFLYIVNQIDDANDCIPAINFENVCVRDYFPFKLNC